MPGTADGDAPDAVLIDSMDKSPNQITQKTQIQVSKRTGTVRSSWKLRYQDFLPSRGGNGDINLETFKSLVERANDWLRKCPEVQVRGCETITWMDHDPKTLGDSEQMVLTRKISEGGRNYFMRGLRLWLSPRPNIKSHVQHTLCCTDLTPESSDTIHSMAARANNKLQNTIKGEILAIETVSVPLFNGSVDNNLTRWTEKVNEDTSFAFCLRIFYHKEDTTNITIGLKDFIPLPTDDGYQGFAELSDRANTWLKDQSDLRVTNMQSLMVQKDNEGPHLETGSACFYKMPGVRNENPTEFFRILRVAYVCPKSDSVTEMPIIYPFTYETFTPELVLAKDPSKGAKEHLERMKDLYARLNSYLKNNSAGGDIICVETVMNPMQIFPEENAQPTPVTSDEEMKFLFTIRLYTTGQIMDIDGNGRVTSGPRSPSMRGQKNGGGPRHHPGPIFLGRVVTRRYKYRWLVVAITVFTCMTIIVVISVISSNT